MALSGKGTSFLNVVADRVLTWKLPSPARIQNRQWNQSPTPDSRFEAAQDRMSAQSQGISCLPRARIGFRPQNLQRPRNPRVLMSDLFPLVSHGRAKMARDGAFQTAHLRLR